ncbi:STAS domain-containing protein [Amycolatopsis magusensis]|uniref:STAS domain-containing protein n=1 Tax=Amycolatopsis magusensis TaxID=882444 RepID=UPI0037BC01A8
MPAESGDQPADGGLWSVAVGERDGVTVVSLSGELDLAAVDDLGEALGTALDSGGEGLVIDMIGVGFCDSSCLHALLRAAARARTSGTGFALVAVSPAVVRPITVLQLREMLPITGSVSEAVAWVRER